MPGPLGGNGGLPRKPCGGPLKRGSSPINPGGGPRSLNGGGPLMLIRGSSNGNRGILMPGGPGGPRDPPNHGGRPPRTGAPKRGGNPRLSGPVSTINQAH